MKPNPALATYLRAVNRWRERRGWPPVDPRQLRGRDTRWLAGQVQGREPGARVTKPMRADPNGEVSPLIYEASPVEILIDASTAPAAGIEQEEQ